MISKQCGLMIFIKGFPETLSPNELCSELDQLLSCAKDERIFSRGCICGCQIIRITPPGEMRAEYYAIAGLKPPAFALRAIKILNGSELSGRTIEVHRYRLRSHFCTGKAAFAGSHIPGSQLQNYLRREGLRVEIVGTTGIGHLLSLSWNSFIQQVFGKAKRRNLGQAISMRV